MNKVLKITLKTDIEKEEVYNVNSKIVDLHIRLSNCKTITLEKNGKLYTTGYATK